MTSSPGRALAVLLLLLSALAGAPAAASDRPGDFDFYVLALSWSPSHCEAERRDDGLQCDGRGDFAFVVHGLWPQRERGWPEYCNAGDRPSRREVDGVLDLMPSRGLVRHQWEKHGSCSGLDPAGFLALVRAARAAVTVPGPLRRVDRRTMVSPDAVEAAFRAANPGLPADGIAVTCDGGRLEEVRVCLTRDLAFRGCPEVDRRDCRAGSVSMPPVR